MKVILLVSPLENEYWNKDWSFRQTDSWNCSFVCKCWILFTSTLQQQQKFTSKMYFKYCNDINIFQALDLKPNQVDWVMRHMGHSLDVHKIHYRATSDIIERTKVAKILLLQDEGRLEEFCNKSLDDIQLSGTHFFNIRNRHISMWAGVHWWDGVIHFFVIHAWILK